ATVVRYYGGIKLGAGGLVRAYTDAVAQALQQAEKVAPVALVQVHCELPYAHESTARHLLAQADGELLEVRHAGSVSLFMRFHEAALAGLMDQLMMATLWLLACRVLL